MSKTWFGFVASTTVAMVCMALGIWPAVVICSFCSGAFFTRLHDGPRP